MFKTSEAARMLNVHPSTLNNWYESGKIKATTTAGGHRRYELSEIERIRGPFDPLAEIDKAIYRLLEVREVIKEGLDG